MGRGDKKSKRGKIFMGTYGNSRPRKSSDNAISSSKSKKIEPKKATVKKTTAKKKIEKKK